LPEKEYRTKYSLSTSSLRSMDSAGECPISSRTVIDVQVHRADSGAMRISSGCCLCAGPLGGRQVAERDREMGIGAGDGPVRIEELEQPGEK
jgi:hypothetical protein